MLGLDFIRENPGAVERAIKEKGVDLDLDALLQLGAEVRALRTQIDQLRTERNSISASFKDAKPEERAALGARAKEAGAKAGELEKELAEREAALNALLLRVPNIPYEGAPVGPDETFNVVIRREGEPPKFDFEPLDHVALIEKNDWAELGRIVQVSGSRTYCLKGRLALLELKLMGWALQRIAEAGFTAITVPALAREQAFLNQGQFPGHVEETYALPNDDLYLAGTAEVALTSLHSGEIIENDKLPILYAGISPCFRQVSRDPQLLDPARRAGAAGEHPLPRTRREGAVRAHAQQHCAGLSADPRAFAGESPDGGRAREASARAAGASRRRVSLNAGGRATTGHRAAQSAWSSSAGTLPACGMGSARVEPSAPPKGLQSSSFRGSSPRTEPPFRCARRSPTRDGASSLGAWA